MTVTWSVLSHSREAGYLYSKLFSSMSNKLGRLRRSIARDAIRRIGLKNKLRNRLREFWPVNSSLLLFS